MTSTDLRYPIGEFLPVPVSTAEQRRAWIADLAALPVHMREAAAGLSNAQLDTPYRPGGWSVRQLVHHVADSHMNGYIRLKLALTEDTPTIKPYDENAWARLADSRMPIDGPLAILDHVHARWVTIHEALGTADYERRFFHPERNEHLTVDLHLQLYSWHSRHHVAHIRALRLRQGW